MLVPSLVPAGDFLGGFLGLHLGLLAAAREGTREGPREGTEGGTLAPPSILNTGRAQGKRRERTRQPHLVLTPKGRKGRAQGEGTRGWHKGRAQGAKAKGGHKGGHKVAPLVGHKVAPLEGTRDGTRLESVRPGTGI